MANARRNNYHFHRPSTVPKELIGQYEQRALSQESLILSFFISVGDGLTLSDVRFIVRTLNVMMAPSSIPRALTNLCTDKMLVLTEEERDGEYNVRNRVYRIFKPQNI